MSDVKRFLAPVNDTCDMDSYQMVVLASDYAALEAELARLRAGQEPVAFQKPSVLKDCNVRYSASTAPQPSAVPDAITMADVMRAWEYAEDHPHKYLRGTTNWCAAVAHSLNQRNPSTPATVQGDGWIPIIERLPQIKQVLSEKCTLEGREIPTLYRSGMVLTFDGSRVSAGIVEWFHSKSPLNNVTHWMPLPAAPGRQEVK